MPQHRQAASIGPFPLSLSLSSLKHTLGRIVASQHHRPNRMRTNLSCLIFTINVLLLLSFSLNLTPKNGFKLQLSSRSLVSPQKQTDTNSHTPSEMSIRPERESGLLMHV